MVRPRILPWHATPYVVSGASGLHIMLRIWRAVHAPPSSTTLVAFLLAHSDVLLVLCGSPIVVWRLARQIQQHSQDAQPRVPLRELPPLSVIRRTIHDLRQVFTALLLGLGLIERRAHEGRHHEVTRLAQRLQMVVAEGNETLNALDTPVRTDGRAP